MGNSYVWWGDMWGWDITLRRSNQTRSAARWVEGTAIQIPNRTQNMKKTPSSILATKAISPGFFHPNKTKYNRP